MKTKFWTGYLLAVLIMLSGVYFVTAQMSDAPLVLSNLEMEQLSGTLTDWDCVEMEACTSIPCNNNNLQEVKGFTGCYSCETTPNLVCFYLDKDIHGREYCVTCAIYQYEHTCGQSANLASVHVKTSYKPCGVP